MNPTRLPRLSPMYDYSRYRRALPTMVEPARRRRRPVSRLLALIVLSTAVFFAGRWTLGLFGLTNHVIEAPATVRAEDTGTVTILLEGGESRRAEDGMKIYPGEQLTTEANGHASIAFFDGTTARLDEQTIVTVEQSERGDRASMLALRLGQGSLWVAVPAVTLSGSVTRQVESPFATFTLPSPSEVLVGPSSIAVYRAAGEGVLLRINGQDITIGEGQLFALPAEGEPSGDLFAYRSPLGADAFSAFVRDSRRLLGVSAPSSAVSAVPDVLIVTEPSPDAAITQSTLAVAGTVGASVKSILINGLPATIDPATRAFRQDVSYPEGLATFSIKIQALDADGEVVADAERSVRRKTAVYASPAITIPAKQGETYRTQRAEVVMRGTAPAGATGIMVNDYKLQLFDPAKGEWSYLARLDLGNLRAGTNTYDVVALYENGAQKSDAVRLTILHEPGAEGVVSGDAPPPPPPASASSAAPVLHNQPLTPGVLQVTAPAEGTSARTNTGTLIEGVTSADTASIWVNDYRLQLYTPGKTTWNYIASPALSNMKRGENVYVIIARNKEGQVLDRMEYTITFEP